ncbi:MAG: carboxypeptidase regulatory-like domain-containing protein [Terracidiphilus sp.]
MTDFMAARHKVAIAGLVLDGLSGKPIAGAHLELTAKPTAYEEKLSWLKAGRSVQGLKAQSPDTTRTRFDGLFFFLDLPEGSYKLVGFMPKKGVSRSPLGLANRDQQDPFQSKGDKRYGKAQFDAAVSYGPEGFGRLTVLRLQPTGIKGRVVTFSKQTAVLLAEVRIKGSGEKTFTDAEGQYTISGILPNERRQRTVQVRARGYRDQSVEVMIDKPGTCTKLEDIRLVREGE